MLLRKIISTLEVKVLAVDRMLVNEWWNFKKVRSPFSRIFLVLSGQAYVTHHGKTFCLEPGVLHQIPCYCQADYYCPHHMELYYACFTSRMGDGLDLFSLYEFEYQVRVGSRELDLFRRCLELNPDRGLVTVDPYQPNNKYFNPQDEFLVDCSRMADAVESDGLLRQLLAPVLRTGKPLNPSAIKGINRFQAVFSYIETHLANTIRQEDLAKIAGINRSYFADLFHKLVGATPLEYITQRRVEASQILLLTTTKSIKEVALESGFASSAAYCKIFRRLCHQTPKHYRTTHPLF